jgi:hypothetical protein
MIPAHCEHLLIPSGFSFHFSAPPPRDVSSTHHLTGSDPDAAVCAILALAQAGNFEAVRHAIRLMKEHDDGYVWMQCSGLLAYIAPSSILLELIDSFTTEMASQDGPTIEWIIETLGESTLLWTPSKIVELHRQMTPDDRLRYCGVVRRLSFMLEDKSGPILEGPADLLLNPDHEDWEDEDWSCDFPPYENMVLDQAGELAAKHPGQSAFFMAEPLSLPKLAEATLLKVQRNRDCEFVATARMLLEANTGRNLVGFYDLDTYNLNPITAAALLEDLLENGELERFEPGVRYFFGHRIPD